MIIRRYWDSCAFLGWLADEPDKQKECESVLVAAEESNVEIVTSAITIAEVIKLKGAERLKEESEQKIKDFFENEWIIVRNVDRFIAEYAGCAARSV